MTSEESKNTESEVLAEKNESLDTVGVGHTKGDFSSRSTNIKKRSSSNGSTSAFSDAKMGSKAVLGSMEVAVDNNIERAMKVLKRKLIKEGLFKELKSRRYYEKPSERKKRKLKESHKKRRKDEARKHKNQLLF